MRRSAVKAMMRAGINQHSAMSITGHKTDGIFRRYHIIDHSEYVSAVAKMERVAVREEQAASAQLDRKPQSRTQNSFGHGRNGQVGVIASAVNMQVLARLAP